MERFVDRKVSVSASLSIETIDKIDQVMKDRKCHTSAAIDYLIHMGWVYVYNVLPAQQDFREKHHADRVKPQDHHSASQKRDKKGRFA